MFDLKQTDLLKLDTNGTLVLKQAYSETLGAENIINAVDRDFSGAGNWVGTNWSVSGGALVHTVGANSATLANSFMTTAPAAGIKFRVVATVETTVIGSFQISIGGTGATAIGNVVGSKLFYTVDIVCTNTGALTLIPDATWVGQVHDISVKVVTTIGNKMLSLLNYSGTEKAYIDKD